MQFRFRILTLLLLLLPSPFLVAQVSSATVTGSVTDPSKAVVPNASIIATEQATGTQTRAISNKSGEYTLPLLKPGTYDITATAPGFQTYQQHGLPLSSGDHPTIDISLAIGEIGQTVVVTAAAPLLGTEDANIGQVVPGELLDSIPLSGRTPMSVAQFTVGVVATTNPVGVRPFDNSAVAGFSVGGLPNKNSEILMDGSPDNASDNAPAYELPMDAAREVSIKVFESDAAYGHSGGAVANQITKSGTNRLHGSLSEFNQNSGFNAYPYFSKRSPVYKPSVSRQNQFGGTIGGPVSIPKLFDGRDKIFFFFAYEGFYDSGTGGSYTSVPTAAERTGDFSQVLSQGSTRTDTECSKTAGGVTTKVISAPYNSQAIFDPASGKVNAACAALGFTIYDRTPFANNNIASGILPLSPVALKALAFFPAPNAPGNAYGQNNYYTTAETGDRYNNELGRLDWNLSPRQRVYFTGRHNQRAQYNNQVFGASNPALGDFLYRANYGYSLGDIITITQSLLAEVRLNYTRYSQPSYTNGDGFNPASLGLPALQSAHLMFPRFFFNNGSVTNLGATTQTPGTAPFNSYDLFADAIKTIGVHTLKFGVDARQFQKGNFTFGNSAGLYQFNGDYTDAFGTDPTCCAVGADTAAFLLGLPSAASYDLNSHAVANQNYLGLFIQDDWRATSNLTINLGFRMDKDFSPTEREGTAVSGFNFTATNPYSAAATAAYAANPNSVLPAGNFKVLGGLTFNTPGSRISNFTSTMFSPRVGLAYKPTFTKDTVIRAGFGIFVIPIFPFNNSIQQQGFSATTQAPIVPYAPPTAGGPGTLSNPFPAGLAQPTGSSLGLATFAGQAISFLDPNIKNGYAERWHLGVQHQFSGNWLLDVFYEGSTGRRLPINENINYVQQQYETTASNPGLSASVANPFYGLIPNGGSLNTSSNVNLTTLLQTYPEFGALTEYNVPVGSSIFHALDVHVEHRTGYGLSITANYQWSKLLEAVSFLNNPGDAFLERRISQYDHPVHAVIAVSYKLPFGRGRHFGSKIPRYLDLPLGGWNIASSWFYQQGAPLTLGNFIPTGEAINYNARQATEFVVNGNTSGTCPAFNVNAFVNSVTTTSGANCQLRDTAATGAQPVNNLRTFPSQFANLRNDALNDWDASILKNFNFTEHTFFQLRLEGFNVNNRPVFSGPNLSPTSGSFGQITGTQNSNRVLQVGARIVF